MTIYLRGTTWHYDFVSGGKRYRGSTGFSVKEKKKAKAKEEEIKVQIREGHSLEMVWEQQRRRLAAGKAIAFSQETLWDIFSKNVVAGKGRLTQYRKYLSALCDWVTEKYPDLDNVGSFTTEMGREYIAYVLSQDGSNSTKNELIKMPRRLFRLLGREGGIIENPFDGWKALPNDQEDREAFTPEELKLIGEKATGWIYSLCLTCLSTGLREGDACLLKKSNVDLKAGWLRNIKASKTGKTLDIPMMPGLEKHIRERLQEDDSSEYIFPELANRYIKQPNRIGEDIKAFFQEIGLVGTRKKVTGYRRLVSKKDVHSFRHTFVYLAALHGWPLPVVQAIVQHSSPAMTRIYMSHADAKEKEKYFRQVPEYLTGTPATKTNPIENIIRMVEQDQPKDQIISELRKVQGQLQI